MEYSVPLCCVFVPRSSEPTYLDWLNNLTRIFWAFINWEHLGVHLEFVALSIIYRKKDVSSSHLCWCILQAIFWWHVHVAYISVLNPYIKCILNRQIVSILHSGSTKGTNIMEFVKGYTLWFQNGNWKFASNDFFLHLEDGAHLLQCSVTHAQRGRKGRIALVKGRATCQLADILLVLYVS